MVKVQFTSNLRRHMECPTLDVEATNVRGALEQVFADNPRIRGYVLDDQGFLRKHVVVFVNGEQITDRVHLTDAVGDGGEIFVMQALSGGSQETI